MSLSLSLVNLKIQLRMYFCSQVLLTFIYFVPACLSAAIAKLSSVTSQSVFDLSCPLDVATLDCLS